MAFIAISDRAGNPAWANPVTGEIRYGANPDEGRIAAPPQAPQAAPQPAQALPPYYDTNSPFDYLVEREMAKECESNAAPNGVYQWNWSTHNCFFSPIAPRPTPQPTPQPGPRPSPQPQPAVQPTQGLPFPDLSGIVKPLQDAINELKNSFGGDILDITHDIETIKTGIGNQVFGVVDAVTKPVGKALVDVQSQLGNITKGLVPNVLGAVAFALGGVEHIVGTFLQNAADVVDVAGAFGDLISEKKEAIQQSAFDVLTSGLKEGLKDLAKDVDSTPPRPTISAIFDHSQRANLPEYLQQWMNKTQEGKDFSDTLTRAFMWIALPLSIIQSVAEPARQAIAQQAFRQFPSNMLDISALIQAQRAGILAPESAVDEAKAQGFNESRYDTLRMLAEQFPTPDETIRAWLRGAITDSDKEYILRRQGYGALGQDILNTLANPLPPVADLVRFALRDVFSPAIVERFQLRQNFPSSFLEQAKKIGLSQEVAEWYWMAHWDLPSANQGFEMLQRGVIEREDLEFLLQAADVMPVWRNRLLAIAYNPLTRVDTRRLYRDEIITFDEMVQAYRSQGYDATNALRLSEWTKKNAHKEKRLELKDLTDGLRTRIVGGVVGGTFDDKEGTRLLSELGYDATEITAFLAEARLIRKEKREARIVELIGDLYVKGRRTKAETTTHLQEFGATAGEIELRFLEWDLERDLRAPSEREEKERDLTAAFVLNGIRDDIIKEDEGRRMLVTMRYDKREIELQIARVMFDKNEQVQKDIIEIAHAEYVKGKIDDVTVRERLDKANVRATRRDALIVKWESERKVKSIDIPFSLVGDMFQRSGDVTWTTQYLGRLGLDVDETKRVMDHWNAKAVEKAEREQRAQEKRELQAEKKGKGKA